MGVGDTIFFGPEAEFFVFDDVKYAADPYNTGFKLDSIEFPTNSDTEYEGGNLGHRIGTKKGYFPVPPQDIGAGHALGDARGHGQMGVKVEKHHHEVASAQHELGMKFSPLTLMADQLHDLQILHPAGRPDLRQDRDLHAEADLWRQRLGHALPPVDLEGRQAGFRRKQICRPFGDVPVLHRRHHQARARRSTPSPTRPPTPTSDLVPGFEAPVLLAYSARNRSASCRIPYTANPKAKRVEVRFPDPLANPYLALRGNDDGRPRRRQEQARSGLRDRQGPL